MTAENLKIKKRILKDLERSYEMTMSDIKRYIRQTGKINIDVVKRLIDFNYFRNTNPVHLWSYITHNDDDFLVAMDMYELELWIAETYGADAELLDSIEDEIGYYSTIVVPAKF